MDIWAWRWVLWAGIFLCIELLAMRAGRGTLSATVWRFIGVGVAHPSARVVWARRAVLCLLAWLVVHLLTGGWV
jgi:hypothetical protein